MTLPPAGAIPPVPTAAIAMSDTARLGSHLRDRDQFMLEIASALQQLQGQAALAQIMPAALAALGRAVQADGVHLYQWTPSPQGDRWQWLIPAPNPDAIPLTPPLFPRLLATAHLPDWLAQLQTLQVVSKVATHFSATEAQLLTPPGINTVCLWPIAVEATFWGWVGFENYSRDRLEADSAQALMQSVMGNIGQLIRQRQVDAELQDSQQFLQLVMDNIPQFIFWKDTNSRYLGCNQRWATMAQLQHPNDVRGLCDADLPWTPQQQAWYIECDRQVITTGEPILRVRYPQRLPDGELVWREASKLPIFNAQQHIIGVLGLIEDITEREKAETAIREQEEQFRTLVANIPGAVYRCLYDDQWTMHYISAAVEDIVGYAATAFIDQTQSWFNCIHPDDQDLVVTKVEAGLTTQTPFIVEYRVIHANEQVRWVYEKGRGVFDPEGLLICLDGVIFDITDRKLAEEALRDSESTNRALIEAIPDLLMRMRRDGTYIGASNSNNINLYQVDTDFNGTHLFDSLPRPQAEQRLAVVQQALATGEVQLYEQQLECGGGIQEEEVRIVPCGADEVLVMVRDITIRKRAEAALRQLNEELEQKVEERTAQIQQNLRDLEQIQTDLRRSQQRLALIVDQAPIAVIDWTTTGQISGWNAAAEQIFGYSKALAIGQTASLLAAPEEPDGIAVMVSELLTRSGQPTATGPHHRQYVNLTRSGHPIICDWYNTPLIDAEGAVVGLASVVIDVTEREYAQAELRKSQQKMALLVQQTPLAVVEWTADARVLSWNPAAERIFGYTAAEALGQHTTFLCTAAVKPYVEEICRDLIAQRGGTRSVNPNLTKAGREIICEWYTTPLVDAEGEVVGLTSLIADVTEQQQAEAERQRQAEALEAMVQELRQTQTQLVQSEKMSSLGQLVAGVAHEINNPVSFIYGNLNYAQNYIQDLTGLLNLYQTHYPQPEPAIVAEMTAIDLDFLLADLPKMLESMKVGADRIKQIVLSLRTFSRMDEAEQKAVDIHAGIDSTVMILQHRLKATSDRPDIDLQAHYSDLSKIECYPGQLNQVFMNLISNAIDALEEYYPIQIDRDPAWIPQIKIYTLAINPQTICIKIVDNGPGIPPALRSRIFDPFFTTKSVGKGTGMGLSISYQIITDKHRGQLLCESTEAGTTFSIHLPIQLTR